MTVTEARTVCLTLSAEPRGICSRSAPAAIRQGTKFLEGMYLASPSSGRPIRISPAFQQLSPPIIVVGMHRSGTSLVSGMLSLMGVQMYPHGLPRQEGGRIVLPNAEERMNGYAEAE